MHKGDYQHDQDIHANRTKHTTPTQSHNSIAYIISNASSTQSCTIVQEEEKEEKFVYAHHTDVQYWYVFVVIRIICTLTSWSLFHAPFSVDGV